jgi:hypothetical protein
MSINATGGFMHFGGASHSLSSSSPITVCVRSIPDGKGEEEVSIIINAPRRDRRAVSGLQLVIPL